MNELIEKFYKKHNVDNIKSLNRDQQIELNKILIKIIEEQVNKSSLKQEEKQDLQDLIEIKKITITKNKNRSYNYYSEKNTFKNIRIKQLKKIISYTYKSKEPEECKNYRELKNWCKKQTNIIAEFIDEEETLIV